MAKPSFEAGLSRRERQIMEAIYAKGEASALEVLKAMEEPPGYSTVRKLLSILETKGYVRHRREGPRYLYSPVRPASQAARGMMRRMLDTFFQGSTEQAVATLLEVSGSKMSDEEIRRLTERLKELKKP